MKENIPSLTLSKAQTLLDNKYRIKLSVEGIRAIWYRYNLSGLSKNDLEHTINPELHNGVKNAEQTLANGDMQKTAQMLNFLPTCEGEKILKKIPDRLLSLPRRLEKLDLIFYEIPFSETVLKARGIREEAEEHNLFFTSLHAGILEFMALDWEDNYREQISLTRKLKKKLKKVNGQSSCLRNLRAEILFAEVRSLASSGKIKKALICLKEMENLFRRASHSSFSISLASTYSTIGFYKRSWHWLKKSIKYNKKTNLVDTYLAANLAIAGDYKATKKILRSIGKKPPGSKSLNMLTNALYSVGQGKIDEAMRFANLAQDIAEKRKIHSCLWSSTFVFACCLCSLGKAVEARRLIKRVSTQLRKCLVKSDSFFCAILLGHNLLSKNVALMPNIKLTLLVRDASYSLKLGDYRKAFNYASVHRLMGLFHRLVLFFPKPVNKLIAKGKPTGLPKALLKLPVFQKNIPVYHLRFLGTVHIYRNNTKLHRLTPKYASFIIQLSIKKKIELNSLYRNFWPHAKNPRGSLSHLLFGLRRYLRLPTDTLFIKQGFLHFKGYIITDYQEFEQTLVHAKTLERASEWGFAKKQFLRAFKLFRGEPFRKMYDPWSEHMRWVLLNKLESEAIGFAESCLENNNEIRQKKRRTPKRVADAKRVLEKVAGIIPNSEESAKILQTL